MNRSTIPPCEDPEVAQEIEQLFSEIYGDISTTFLWPVIEMPDLSKDASEAVFKIDLNYTKDEIMTMLEEFVSAHLKSYRENHRQHILRKAPMKWLDYLELWHLRLGYPTWIRDDDGFKFPRAKRSKGGSRCRQNPTGFPLYRL